MKIELSLKALTPYHSAPVAAAPYVVTDDGRIKAKMAGIVGSPLTRTYVEPKYIGATNEVQYYPVIRAMQIAKQFRNRLNRNLFSALQRRGLSIKSSGVYAGLEVGAASGKPVKLDPSLEMVTQALEQPLAIFGGGIYSLSSILRVGDANILHTTLLDEKLVTMPPHLNINQVIDIESYRLTFAAPITRTDPIAQIATPQQLENLSVLDEHKKQITEWQAGVKNAQKKRAGDASEKKSDLNNLVAIEAVLAGTTFASTLNLPDEAGDAVKGAIFAVLAEMVGEGVSIGGRVARGYGQMAVDVSIDGQSFLIDNHETEIAAYSDWLDTVKPNDLAAYYDQA